MLFKKIKKFKNTYAPSSNKDSDVGDIVLKNEEFFEINENKELIPLKNKMFHLLTKETNGV